MGENKLYNLGLVVGRFEPIHLGHEKIINISLNSCRKTALLVTCNDIDERNPYSFEYISYLINKIYHDEINEKKLKIIPFKNDIPFDEEYGKKIISVVKNNFLEEPDFIAYGSDKNISKCFDNKTRDRLFEFIVNREDLKISATSIREALKCDNFEFLKKYLDPKIHDEIYSLKKNNKFI